jgi:murein tripeptide amidase MpaA
MLKEVADLQGKDQVTVDVLTYSLVGLAIPLLTITNNSDNAFKNVILVSSRIHPGETNASYMCRGLLRALTSNAPNIKEFLDKNIVKVIPMINPDGVVFGNFRTSITASI